MGEPLRLRVLIRKPRKLYRLVDELKSKRIPTLRPPALGNTSAFQHNMLAFMLLKIIAHGEPRLAATNDDRIPTFSH